MRFPEVNKLRFNEDLATIHGYLCADGYVVKNLDHQRHKYYHIALRNTCEILLNDFCERCRREFNVSPRIYKNQRCIFQSKEIYYRLTEVQSYYSSNWKLPKLPKNFAKLWLRAYFDCDGWVQFKEKQDRRIGLDSINEEGLASIKTELKRFDINSIIREVGGRSIYRMYICGRENLKKFEKAIGFLHPKKNEKLKLALDSYLDYEWRFPADEELLGEFVLALIKTRAKIKNNGILRINSIVGENLTKLSFHLRNLFGIDSRVYGPWVNGYGTKYYVLAIQKKEEIMKAKNVFRI